MHPPICEFQAAAQCHETRSRFSGAQGGSDRTRARDLRRDRPVQEVVKFFAPQILSCYKQKALTVALAKGKEDTRARAGSCALSLLSAPLCVHVLQALEQQPSSLIDLRRAVGSPPETTMRGQLRALTEIGVLERHRQHGFPGSVAYKLARSGRELLEVGQVLQTWLAGSPDGPLGLGSIAAKSAIKALVEGWSSAIVRALAAKPLSLTELNRLISGITYPSLERRLGAMRLAGQIGACPSAVGRGTPYAATEWLRHSIAPMAAATSWEGRHVASVVAPTSRLDVEAGLLLAVPLITLESDQSGLCRLAVELRDGDGEHRLAGVTVGVREGQLTSCTCRLEGEASAWAVGSIPAWLSAVTVQDANALEVGGDCHLAMALLDGLHEALFRVPQRT